MKFLNSHPVLNHSDALKNICKPLNLLGIKYFSHAHICDKRNMTALANCPTFFELYFRKGYHNYDLHNSTSETSTEYVIWDTITRKNQTSAMHEDFMACGYGHTFSIVINEKNQKDCFHFGTALGNEYMNGQYLKLIDVLERFISYFKESVASLTALSVAYKMPIQLKSNSRFLLAKPPLLHYEFDKQISTKRFYSLNQSHYLTPREVECLSYLAQGKTFEEVALILNIAPRTVKAHIQAIKQKTGCENQFQLGMLYTKLCK